MKNNFENQEKKIEQEPRFKFDDLEKNINTIPDIEERERVTNCLNELKKNCQEYLVLDKSYQKARQALQEVVSGDNEAREGALVELENCIFSMTSKKNVITDGQNILYRFFKSYDLDTSWAEGFADEQYFKEWIIERNKELQN